MDDTKLLFELYKRLDYDRNTGELRRKAGFTGVVAGSLIGTIDSGGKLQASFMKRRYMVHALVWCMENGTLPSGVIAHVNGDKLDNRIDNLKETTITQITRDNGYYDQLAILKQQRDAMGIWKPKALKKTYQEKQLTARLYRENNRELYRKSGRKHHHANKNNATYRAAKACRNLLNRLLYDAKQSKTERTEYMHGYTVDEFKHHIEAQFKPWMNWANHGEWHVDHIKPVSLFIQEGITDPIIINALSNLQPLAATANLRKKNKYVQVNQS